MRYIIVSIIMIFATAVIVSIFPYLKNDPAVWLGLGAIMVCLGLLLMKILDILVGKNETPYTPREPDGTEDN